MIYLINDFATTQTTPKDIWLTEYGQPVFVTKLSTAFSDIPQGSNLVGQIDNWNPNRYQLTDKGNLTQSGVNYCAMMGVQEDVASLTKFVTNVKRMLKTTRAP